MISDMAFCKCLILFLFAAPAWAGIVEDVRTALAQSNFSAADSELNAYRSRHGITPEYVEANSWMGRAALEAHQYDQATAYAKQTKNLAVEQLKQRPLDAEPRLPIALGAAIEVESQALAAQGERTQAVAILQAALRTYGTTSIRARLQKNLNLLSFEGHPAPALRAEQFLGSKPPVLAQLKGSPVLLFFWAHWCGDCKAEAPIIAQLRSEFAPKGLAVVGPIVFVDSSDIQAANGCRVGARAEIAERAQHANDRNAGRPAGRSARADAQVPGRQGRRTARPCPSARRPGSRPGAAGRPLGAFEGGVVHARRVRAVGGHRDRVGGLGEGGVAGVVEGGGAEGSGAVVEGDCAYRDGRSGA